MAAGTVGYTDTRGNKDYTSMIASQIGRRLKESSNMASEERAYAEKQAEAGGTSLEEAGIGKGYFFGRALGSRFGGDRIARAKGRMGMGGAGTNPATNYKERFRGGFDYNVTNQSITDVAPLSNALVVGLRGVEQGLSDVAGAIQRQGTVLNQLSQSQADMAKATMFNGYLFAMFQSQQKRAQGRASLRREEASIEGRGRRKIGGGSFGGAGGGRGMINVTPGGRRSGGGFNPIRDGLGSFGTSQLLGRNTVTRKAVSTGKNLAKGIDLGKVARNTSTLLSLPATGVRSLLTNAKNLKPLASIRALRDTLMAQSAAGWLGKKFSAIDQLRNFFGVSPFDPDFPRQMGGAAARAKGSAGAMESMLSGLDPKQQKEFLTILGGKRGAEYWNDYLATPKFKPETIATTQRMLPIRPDPNTSILPKGTTGLDDAIEVAATRRIADLSDAGFKTADIATDQLVKQGTKKGLYKGGKLTKMLVKRFGAAGTRSLLKKIPVVAGAAGVLFGIQRALEGDFFGAGLEITSGLLGATGVGGGLGLAIDGFLLGRDLGAIPMAEGGIVKGMRGRGLPMLLGAGLPAVVGEGGSDEAVLPLNKKTFLNFGLGMMDAMKDKKSDYAKFVGMGVFSGIGDAASGGLFESIGGGISNIVDGIKDMFGNFKDNFKETFNNLKEKLGNTFNNLKEKFGEKFSNFKDSLVNKYNNFKDSVGNKINNVKQWWNKDTSDGSMVDNARVGIKNWWNKAFGKKDANVENGNVNVVPGTLPSNYKEEEAKYFQTGMYTPNVENSAINVIPGNMTGHTVITNNYYGGGGNSGGVETGEGNPTMNDLGFEGLVTNYALATK